MRLLPHPLQMPFLKKASKNFKKFQKNVKILIMYIIYMYTIIITVSLLYHIIEQAWLCTLLCSFPLPVLLLPVVSLPVLVLCSLMCFVVWLLTALLMSSTYSTCTCVQHVNHVHVHVTRTRYGLRLCTAVHTAVVQL